MPHGTLQTCPTGPPLRLLDALDVEGDVNLVADLVQAGVHAVIAALEDQAAREANPRRALGKLDGLAATEHKRDRLLGAVHGQVAGYLVASLDRLDRRALESHHGKLLDIEEI